MLCQIKNKVFLYFCFQKKSHNIFSVRFFDFFKILHILQWMRNFLSLRKTKMPTDEQNQNPIQGNLQAGIA